MDGNCTDLKCACKRHVIQAYGRYPIYEAAEGGYYYEGREPLDFDVYPSRDDAIRDLLEFAQVENKGLSDADEGFLLAIVRADYAKALTINHTLISDGYEYHVEPYCERGRSDKGYTPYS